ncbi:hypothetical protein CEXT_337421 [Caerostris extrusa]|uniref:Uncharacterized protein n=1 Tax=Caerostris extrusa TaxID=172846 RepID=A0AAV4N0T1_CAEEX|nr:hypothetical protein CEXT_337421 [Caerostris extrusa]
MANKISTHPCGVGGLGEGLEEPEEWGRVCSHGHVDDGGELGVGRLVQVVQVEGVVPQDVRELGQDGQGTRVAVPHVGAALRTHPDTLADDLRKERTSM